MKKILIFIILISISTSSIAECISKEPQVLSDVMKILHCLENEIKELKNSKGNIKKNIIINTFPNIPKPSTSKSTNFKKFKIDLLACKRNSTDVNCDLIITNLGEDSYFAFDKYNDEFIDEKGGGKDVYKLSFVDMGNGKKSRKLYTNIPINVKMVINNVPEDVTQFIRFIIDLDGGYIKLKNVAIQ